MNKTEMIPVTSSNVEAIGYDDANNELHVSFIKGGSYIYSQIPQVLYDEFLVAPSKGQFLDQQIKKAGFPYRKA